MLAVENDTNTNTNYKRNNPVYINGYYLFGKQKM